MIATGYMNDVDQVENDTEERIMQNSGLPRGMRRLVIRQETWGWRFGRVIPIVHPDGQRTNVDIRTLTEMNWDEMERGSRKGYFSIEPHQIASYINRKLLGYLDATGFPRGVVPLEWRPELRKGWIGLQGPRGLWQWKPHPWVVRMYGPEDVMISARIYNLLDMHLDEWADVKEAAIVGSGSTVDAEMRRGRQKDMRSGVEGFFEWEGPGVPIPSETQVRAFLERLVSGQPEKSPRSPD